MGSLYGLVVVLTSDEWFFATCNEWFVATSKKWISQRVTSDFLQRATFTASNGWTLQRVTSSEWISPSIEQQVKSYASSY